MNKPKNEPSFWNLLVRITVKKDGSLLAENWTFSTGVPVDEPEPRMQQTILDAVIQQVVSKRGVARDHVIIDWYGFLLGDTPPEPEVSMDEDRVRLLALAVHQELGTVGCAEVARMLVIGRQDAQSLENHLKQLADPMNLNPKWPRGVQCWVERQLCKLDAAGSSPAPSTKPSRGNMKRTNRIAVATVSILLILLALLVDLRSDSPITSFACSLMVMAISGISARYILRCTAEMVDKAAECEAKEAEREAARAARHREVYQQVVDNAHKIAQDSLSEARHIVDQAFDAAHRLAQDALEEHGLRLQAWIMTSESILITPGVVAKRRVEALAQYVQTVVDFIRLQAGPMGWEQAERLRKDHDVQQSIQAIVAQHPSVQGDLESLAETRNKIADWWLGERKNVVQEKDVPPNSVSIELTRSRAPYLVRLGDRFQYFPDPSLDPENFDKAMTAIAKSPDMGEWPPCGSPHLVRIIARDIDTLDGARQIMELGVGKTIIIAGDP